MDQNGGQNQNTNPMAVTASAGPNANPSDINPSGPPPVIIKPVIQPSVSPTVPQPVPVVTGSPQTSTPSQPVTAVTPVSVTPVITDPDPPIQASAPAVTPMVAASAAPTLTDSQLFDVISIGDVVTDDFIKLLDDQAIIYTDQQGKKMIAMEFGTKLPFDHHEVIEGVGNAANGVVAFARIGLKSSFIANVGGDQYGRDIILALSKQGVDHRFIRINPDKNSNYHFVLRYKTERTILIKHEEYNYIWPTIDPPEVPKWLYFSSISEHAIPYHDKVSDWLDANPNVKLAFQPGTFQMEAGSDRLKRIYQRSEVLILNREEAVTVGGGNHEDINDLFNHLHELGPKIVVITDGAAGAYASDSQTHARYKMPIYPDIAPPVDRTGAGDAFASTFVSALIRGNTIEGALQWAPINSMSVCQKVGAQAGLLTESEIEAYLRKAPPDYKPEPLSA